VTQITRQNPCQPAGWFWWPHAERIARTGDPAQAAAIIAQALGAGAQADAPVTGHDHAPVGAPGPVAAAGPLPRRVLPDRPGQAGRIPPDTRQRARR
jgi:hypothetical protein